MWWHLIYNENLQHSIILKVKQYLALGNVDRNIPKDKSRTTSECLLKNVFDTISSILIKFSTLINLLTVELAFRLNWIKINFLLNILIEYFRHYWWYWGLYDWTLKEVLYQNSYTNTQNVAIDLRKLTLIPSKKGSRIQIANMSIEYVTCFLLYIQSLVSPKLANLLNNFPYFAKFHATFKTFSNV